MEDLRNSAALMSLFPREIEVAKMVAHAKSNKEIGYALGLTEGTIKEYLNRIFRKLSLPNRTALAIWAMRNL